MRTAHAGYQLNFYGRTGQHDIEVVLDQICSKLDKEGHTFARIADGCLHDSIVVDACSGRIIKVVAYKNTPLYGISTSFRGKILEKLAKEICQVADPHCKQEDPETGVRPNGENRALHQAGYDWLCNGARIECKSSQLRWSSTRRAWFVTFSGIKFAGFDGRPNVCFDKLLLVLYTPRGIYVYEHKLAFAISKNGRRTNTQGYLIWETKPEKPSELGQCA